MIYSCQEGFHLTNDSELKNFLGFFCLHGTVSGREADRKLGERENDMTCNKDPLLDSNQGHIWHVL